MSDLFKPFQPTLSKVGLKLFGLSLTSSTPCDSLKSVVHSYLQISADKPTPYPVMPDGALSIFISPNGTIIGGAQSQTRDILIEEQGDYFGIRFYPGALRHFFEFNIAGLTNRFVDQSFLPDWDIANLHTKLYHHKNFKRRASVCENWLLQHYNPQSETPFDQALKLIYQSLGNVKVSSLAANTGWSSRHLNRLFKRHTGLSTKTFSEIVRLQHTCRQLFNTPNESLRLAQDLGFFDQSHLIKDFKKFLLTNPSGFLKRFMSDFYKRSL